ncbi:MAG: branched-chain amino acid transaminase [Candidatus Micrarchaeota archaeon]|nr:branched-chain amino acid transaminase [Candidatus Micrarchaeota archaeon]MDE1847655.1 branched-chain amino acid transaminase [Candidatus Micrarchaeota archaeon]MDE1864476.1 branched-chain amino acid transaminase [Candidatus Micrarchaeota archaeon]
MPRQQYIWYNGKFRKFDDVKVHIFTNTIQYGTGIFEGLRSYPTTDNNIAIFRLHDHVERFFRSAQIYMFQIPFTSQQVENAIIETVKKNKLEHAYIRPFAFFEHKGISLNLLGKQMSVSITTVPFGNYFANKEKGIRCKISSWQRINSAILPPQAKASGNYLGSVLSVADAKLSGYDEAILVSDDGYVAEGTGENIFLVSSNRLITPSPEADILLGITRDSLIKIATSMGFVVEQRNVHREELYTADEVFFTGTAAEITPIISIDSRPVGKGKPGPITKLLAERLSHIASGADSKYAQWLTRIY